MKRKKSQSRGSDDFLPTKNPPGHGPHVIDWSRVRSDMVKLIDAHRELYMSLMDGGWLKDFPGDDYCGLD